MPEVYKAPEAEALTRSGSNVSAASSHYAQCYICFGVLIIIVKETK